VFGTSGTYMVGEFSARDTDWFEIYLPEPSYLTFNLHGCFPNLLQVIQPLQSCYHYSTVSSATGGYQEDAYIEGQFAAGPWWIWVGPSVFTGIECGVEYLLTIEGACPPTANDDSSWGTIKSLFR